MKIDIDQLTEEQLVDLNNRIVARLRFLNHMRAHSEMLEFRIGDRVIFEPEGRTPVAGVLTRYNKKSVTVISDSGHRWNVSPRFLRRAEGLSPSNRKLTSCRSAGSERSMPPNKAYLDSSRKDASGRRDGGEF